jgi:expansin (peptidoglycan-binding protein)
LVTISIFVVKRKSRFYWSKKRVRKTPKPKVVLDQFKPKQPLPLGKKNINNVVNVKDEVLLEMTTNNPDKFGY